MSNTILNINASARQNGSISRQVGSYLVEKLAPQRLIERDLTQPLPHVSEAWIQANFTPPDHRDDDMRATLKISDELVQELKAADVLVIGAPMYNFTIPASLKAWLDMVCRVQETFRYGENGPEGLLSGKKAYVIAVSGGVPIGSPADHATPYLRQVLGFIGITDVAIIAAEGTAMDEDSAKAAALKTADSLLAA